ncbi:hypothetical protein E4U21_006140 [Claviceps maximensis]|nr:hypothetical protein E4U21_006140 [Claviceps maximensis]
MPDRCSLNLRPASARRLPKRYESTESHSEFVRRRATTLRREKKRVRPLGRETKRKRNGDGDGAAAALSPVAATNTHLVLRKEGTRPQRRRVQHRAVAACGSAPWPFSPPLGPFSISGFESDFLCDMSTPLLSLSDIDWGSDDDDDNGSDNGKVVNPDAPPANPRRSATHGTTSTSMSPSTSTMAANRVS